MAMTHLNILPDPSLGLEPAGNDRLARTGRQQSASLRCAGRTGHCVRSPNVTVHIRERLSCPACITVVAAPAPDHAIARGRAGETVWSSAPGTHLRTLPPLPFPMSRRSRSLRSLQSSGRACRDGSEIREDHNRPKLQRIESEHASTGKLPCGNLNLGFMDYLKATDRDPGKLVAHR
jgi:hypothetical protein